MRDPREEGTIQAYLEFDMQGTTYDYDRVYENRHRYRQQRKRILERGCGALVV